MSNITDIVSGIIEKDGKILLVKTIKYNDYTFPGGKHHDGENDSQALRREVSEEIGVEGVVDGLVGTYLFQSRNRTFQRKVFKVDIVNIKDESPQIREPDVFSELVYVTENEALKLVLAPQIGQAIKDYYKKR